MMAIAESSHPEKIVNVPGSPVNGRTYADVLQDAVDYLAFGQNDAGNPRGGWGYSDNQAWSDNSNSGYAVLGLGYAQTSGSTIPAFVKTELNIWITYIQCGTIGPDYGGSGYNSPCSWVNILKTGNLLFEMAFVGNTTADQRVIDAIDYIELHWDDANEDPGWNGTTRAHKQAMYCAMKGFEVLGVKNITVNRSGIDVEVDWYDEFANVLLAQQNADGSWGSDYWGDNLLGTEWALLTLEKAAPQIAMTPGKVTGGGQIKAPIPVKIKAKVVDKASFGFNVMYQEGDPAPKGELEYIDHAAKMNVHAHNMTRLVVSDDKTKAWFEGTCTINGVSGTFKAYVEDNNEPGRNDVFEITLSTGYKAGGPLLSGNIQIHKKP